VILEVMLKTKKGKENSVIRDIKRHARRFPRVQNTTKYGEYGGRSECYVLVTYAVDHLLGDADVEKLKEKYAALKHVEDVTINQAIGPFKENISVKNCHFVFDVDSTLTTGRGTIQNKVRNIFRDMTEGSGHRVYLASGRKMDDLRQDMEDFGAESYGIAENGGILLGFGTDGFLLIGERAEPDKVLAYMKARCRKVKEDIRQGMRLTERIFLDTVTKPKFLEYVEKSKARVSVLASKGSYHVTKEGVDKGSALEKLKTRLRLGANDIVIGVGDSDLDVPLLQEADYGFVVGNGSKDAKAAGIDLGKNYADGVEAMYQKWFRM